VAAMQVVATQAVADTLVAADTAVNLQR